MEARIPKGNFSEHNAKIVAKQQVGKKVIYKKS